MAKKKGLLVASGEIGYQKISSITDVLVVKTERFERWIRRHYKAKASNVPILVRATILSELPGFFGIKFNVESSQLSKVSAIFGVSDVRSGD